jgi:hypothetical protein
MEKLNILNITIKEIVELSQTKTLKDIAKEIPVNEKKLRETLKVVGCTPPPVGKRGWTYKPDNKEVEKDLGVWMIPTRPRKVKSDTKSNDKSKSNSTNASIDNNTNSNASNENNNDNVVIDSKNVVNNDSTNTIVKGDNMVMEIKDLIKGKGKDDSARVYKGIYFDKDIANFLDNVQHGNKSEIVNKILRQYLTDNELM